MEKDITTFSDDKVIEKVKDIIGKLEGAESLEAAKLLVVELQTLIPEEDEKPKEGEEVPEVKEGTEETKEEVKEEVKEEPKDGEDKPKETVEKGEESEVEESEPEKKEEVTTQSKEFKDLAGKEPSHLQEALDLNEQLITKFQEANGEITRLEGLNGQYQNRIVDLEKQVTTYTDEKNIAEKTRMNDKYATVFQEYCDFMGVEDGDKESLGKQMSTYSEDMLDSVSKHIDKKKTTLAEEEPEAATKPSSQLVDEGVKTEGMDYTQLSAAEKTRFLYNKYLEPLTKENNQKSVFGSQDKI